MDSGRSGEGGGRFFFVFFAAAAGEAVVYLSGRYAGRRVMIG